jgi:branched-chain amino acid transport system ATP-binding protein
MTAVREPHAAGNGHVTSAVSVRGLHAGYGRSTVLRNVNVEVRDGAITALLGPNGAGKTTLLATISGLIRPTQGSVSMYGSEITTMSTHRRTRAGLCHIPEGRAIFRSLTVRENLVMQAERGRERYAVERTCDVFPILGERLNQQAGTLSGGQQQMLALARAHVRECRVVLVDEPSLGLAPRAVEEVFAFLATLSKTGIAVLLVDQFASRALALATSAYVLRQGEIAFSGDPASLETDELFDHYLGTTKP